MNHTNEGGCPCDCHDKDFKGWEVNLPSGTCCRHGAPQSSSAREEGTFYPEKLATERWGECCEACTDVHFEKTYPAHTAYLACTNLKCSCHTKSSSAAVEEVCDDLLSDYPTAWALMAKTEPTQHHEECSYRVSNRGVLCDCAAEKVFIETIKLARSRLTKLVEEAEERGRREKK